MDEENSSSSNGFAAHSTSESWVPPRQRQVFTSASSMINAGGLGEPTNSLPLKPSQPTEITTALDLYEQQFFPHEPKSLSGIASRAFLLGLTLALSSIYTIYLLNTSQPIWRAPFSLASLSLFHFLEFYTTALTNVPAANVGSFLLSSNGSAYMIAHLASMLECMLTHIFLPSPLLPELYHSLALITGLSLLMLGQTIRTFAMLTAGPNFSHFVKRHKSQKHTLVTSGIYSWFRHPSYFGYFWWGIGTQLVYGNLVSLLAFSAVLWRFFSRRIEGEEELLVKFFGEEYRRYRRRTRVGIPFIK